MAGAQPHYRSVRSTSPVRFDDRSWSPCVGNRSRSKHDFTWFGPDFLDGGAVRAFRSGQHVLLPSQRGYRD